jgi:hypothetical protein
MSEPIPDWIVEFARCERWIAAALEYDGDTHGIEDVLALVATGECQFWPGEKSAIITEIVRHPKKTVLHFWLAGGDLQELEAMSARIEEWAREQGCQRITLAGRKGWARTFLQGRGYEPQWAVLAKEL